MKWRNQKILKDSVESDIMANLIWMLLLAFGAIIYLFYQMIKLSISFGESWNRLFFKLNQEKVIPNWHYLIALFIAIFLLVNSKLIINYIKELFGVNSSFNRSNDYNFTNQGTRSSRRFSSGLFFNKIKIKPQNDTKDWCLKILFYHPEWDPQEQVTETIKIYKSYGENILKLVTAKEDKLTIDLIDNYVDQEFDLYFDFSLKKGGTILKLSRLGKELFVSKVICYSTFKIVADDSHFDFDLKIKEFSYWKSNNWGS